jgi:hypothetical protein
MMDVHAVFVKHRTSHWQYIDSVWVQKYAWQHGAEQRVSELNAMFSAMSVELVARIVPLTIQDAVARDPQRPATPERDETDKT